MSLVLTTKIHSGGKETLPSLKDTGRVYAFPPCAARDVLANAEVAPHALWDHMPAVSLLIFDACDRDFPVYTQAERKEGH